MITIGWYRPKRIGGWSHWWFGGSAWIEYGCAGIDLTLLGFNIEVIVP